MKCALTSLFGPASFLFEITKKTCKLWSIPFDWALSKYNPNYINDITMKKELIKSTIKDKADQSLLTLSSVIAK